MSAPPKTAEEEAERELAAARIDESTFFLDEYDGVRELLRFDADSGEAAVQRTTDVAPLLDANRRDFNLAPQRWGEWAKVASFDAVAQLHFLNKYGRDPFLRGNEDLLERIVNDPDYCKYRTRPGRVKLRRR